MLRLRLLAGALGLLFLDACGSGQTGSPDCMGPTSCICDPLYNAGALLRVRAESVDSAAGRLSATVLEVLAPHQLVFDLRPDDPVGGSIVDVQPCASGEPTDARPGDELFVLYFAGNTHAHGYPNCNEYQSCVMTVCGGLQQSEFEACRDTCTTDTSTICAQHRTEALLDGALIWIVPWTEPLSFGGSIELSQSEVEVLHSPEACQERFPATPAPPCRDTQHGSGCSPALTIAAGSEPSKLASSWILLLAAVWAGRRFRWLISPLRTRVVAHLKP